MTNFPAIRAVILLILAVLANVGHAQQDPLRVSTVSRAPFSMPTFDGGHTGFSIDLMTAIAEDLGRDIYFVRHDGFSDMLDAVSEGASDAAIANISITSAREAVMDFSQPIFRSGLQIMVPNSQSDLNIFGALFTRQIAMVILVSIAMLFAAGMFVWLFERRKQAYFDRPLKEALFPSFWWALNVVVNGGFEERMPRSAIARVFSVIMIFSSLFIVSIFVAQITAAMTVEALQEGIEGVDDLEGRRVGTIQNATASDFLESYGYSHVVYRDLDEMFRAFEDDKLDAVVFDSPILAHYVDTQGAGKGKLVNRKYKPENYGIALPQNSAIQDRLNQSLLKLHEDGTYDTLVAKWFGDRYERS